jgi:hypothetical protein
MYVTFFWVYPQEWVAGSYGRSMFRFLRSLHIFFRVVAIASIPTSTVQGFLFPHILTTPVVGGVFDDSYSNRNEVEC